MITQCVRRQQRLYSSELHSNWQPLDSQSTAVTTVQRLLVRCMMYPQYLTSSLVYCIEAAVLDGRQYLLIASVNVCCRTAAVAGACDVMGNQLCAPWRKGYREDEHQWTPRKDSHLLRYVTARK